MIKRNWRWILLTLGTLTALVVIYVRTHPLVFMATHQHCIVYAMMQLEQYAEEHDGKYPSHPRGYGNALILLNEDSFNTLTGPGYDPVAFQEAKKSGEDLPEEKCGRVYVQGLTKKSNHELIILFDKLPTPGGDHCSFALARMFAPLAREVLYVGGSKGFIRESEWPNVAQKQVALLIEQGFPREVAERLYALSPR